MPSISLPRLAVWRERPGREVFTHILQDYSLLCMVGNFNPDCTLCLEFEYIHSPGWKYCTLPNLGFDRAR